MNTKELRKIIRRVANVVGSTVPIVVIGGASRPKYQGSPHHYRNKSGDLIRSPNAYRRAWGKPIYYPSTIRIEVGKEWPMHVGLISHSLTENSTKLA